MAVDSAPETAGEDHHLVAPGKYEYYFQNERPAVLSRLIADKHRAHLRVATRGILPQSVVEVGPGEGWFAQACQEAGVQSYLALEASSKGARRLAARGFPVRCVRVPPIPDDLGAVDLVYASHVIEHLPGPDAVLSFLSGCRGLLKPGGKLVLAFPDARQLGVDFWDCDYTHVWPSTPRRVSQAAHDAGLDVIDTRHFSLNLDGARARIIHLLSRLYPYRILRTLAPGREGFWYRGKIFLAPEILMVLRSREG